MQMCSRCKVRPAVVFVTKIENNEQKQEGLCLKCAKELNIKPITDMMDKMGINEEELDQISGQMDSLLGDMDLMADDGEAELNGAPALDLSKIFSSMGMGDPSKKSEKKGAGKEAKEENKRKFLSQFCIDLTAKAREGKLDNIIGREREIERMTQILCRRQKNNPCLIGEPGVGKTALAEGLAQRIVDKKVPYKLQDKEIFLVDMTCLVAGTQFRGQFENRMRGLIEEVKKLGNIILVIDEVHTIVGTGDTEGGMNAANILKPALSRGEIQLIGATTLTEYRKYIEKDAALERRFQPVMVNEPSIEDTVKVLEGIKKYYESFHRLSIPDEVIDDAVELSERYITDRFLPDKAIDLLDEASAHVVLNNNDLNRLGQINDELEKVIKDRETLEAKTEPDDETYSKIADCRVKEIKLQGEKEELEKKCEGVKLTKEDLARVIEVWTGIPAGNIEENDFAKLDRLAGNLKKRIIGQDRACDAVCRAVKRSRAGIMSKKHPVSFIFAGPTGVGKTELVKVLARELFNSPESLIRLDMSEFMEKHSVSRIIGSPPGYVGYDDAGQLTEKIRRKPYSVILFDEIEKAHPDVMNILLQILDDGKITDAHGKEVSFEKTIIIMTTNAGSTNYTNLSGFSSSFSEIEENKTEKALADFLRPEFINRVDEIITFNRLTVDIMEEIAKIQLSDLDEVMKRKGIPFSYTDEVLKLIAKESFSDKYGARNLRRYIQTNIEDKIAEEIIGNYKTGLKSVFVRAQDGSIKVECETR